MIESYYTGPSKDYHELYKRIFKNKDKEIVNLFTKKAAGQNQMNEELGLLRVKIMPEVEHITID